MDGPITDPRVATAAKTCWARPTQWEGTLTDGRFWYLRFRHGELSFGVGTDADDAVWRSMDHRGASRDLSETHGDDAGELDDDEVDLWVTVLLDELLVARA